MPQRCEPDADGRVVVCRTEELAEGERRLIQVNRRRIGVFRVGGRFYALHGTCPHAGGALCEGPLTGTTEPARTAADLSSGEFFGYAYHRQGRILRCAWHGWEFDIQTGRSLVDPERKARTYPVHIDDGHVVVQVTRGARSDAHR